MKRLISLLIISLLLISCGSTKYIPITESERPDEIISNLLPEAPEFPSLNISSIGDEFILDKESVIKLTDFKLNLYPQYIKSVELLIKKPLN